MKIAHISTFPKMRCGIAFYVADLIKSLPKMKHSKYALHYGTNLTQDAASHADVSQSSNLQILAHHISKSDCDVVSLQHEFGIWGGPNGENIYPFLEEIKKPIVSTYHTTSFGNDNPETRKNILRTLVNKSFSNIVLTPKSRDSLCSSLGIPHDLVTVIPHGVPDIIYRSPTFNASDSSNKAIPWKIFSIGFFRPDKGFEETLKALSHVKDMGYFFQYVVAGSSQPQFVEQNSYLKHLRELIIKLELVDFVHIENKFFSHNEQIELVQSSHLGIFAYQESNQSSSGTIPLVLAAGRPVVCTPFEYALSKSFEIYDGLHIAHNFNSTAIAEILIHIFDSSANYTQKCKSIYEKTRQWKWSNVASLYEDVFFNVV